MTGLIIELIISWLLIWIFCRDGLSVLGIFPTQSRLLNFLFGFLVATFCCTLYFLAFTVFTTNSWILNNEFTGKQLLRGSWWTMRSVLFEELIFRGALLYLLIKKSNVYTACIISAICFGIYHWFTFGVMGNFFQMAITFGMTGVWGFMFAMAFARTKSLYLPFGLHFGWNLASTVIFSQGPLGTQFLTMRGEQKLDGVLSLAVFLFQVFAVPAFTYWYLKVLSKKKKSFLAKNKNL